MYEKILELIKKMDDEEIVILWNNYCENTNGFDNEIFNMEMFNELYSNAEP